MSPSEHRCEGARVCERIEQRTQNKRMTFGFVRVCGFLKFHARLRKSTPDGGSAVLPPGRSYKAHWEVLGCALCLLTSSAIPRTVPVWGWGFCPSSRRPRARVLLVVWAWDLVVIRLLCCGLPAPARRQFFALRFVIPDFETQSARGDSVHHPFFPPNVKTFRAIKMS